MIILVQSTKLMRKYGWLISGLLIFNTIKAQEPAASIKKAFARLEADEQMKYGIAAFQVVEKATGKTVFEHNSNIGLAPASSQKVITAAAALEMLGPDFRFTTNFGYTEPVQNGLLKGRLVIEGSGDPTLGSTRYPKTRPEYIGSALKKAFQKAGIQSVSGGITGYLPDYETTTIPNGWIWEDIGNYYGAGHSGLNWNENQYDLWLKPGKVAGQGVSVIRTIPSLNGQSFINELTTGKAGSGDNAFIYFTPGKSQLSIRGSVPCCVDSFRISGAVTDPVEFSLQQIKLLTGAEAPIEKITSAQKFSTSGLKSIYTHYSPGLDSIVYWFLQKSVNLYGEALVHTLAQQVKGSANYDTGISVIQDFWNANGIDKKAINIMDGSGLSPQNRVTAKALVNVMLFASRRPWYNAFYAALPVYNGIKMKSGTIGGAKTYTGYIKSKNGKEYVFAIMANNFSGSSSSINKKLFVVLDSLK
jgi:D-alanyl-D-alanine carboxypeptidase/D-alanyl-D-alanine-endopeptidase (penicillin-binding protein 4)